ncbi:hypothetical protein RUND412_011461, partial [Rhizina undulata]
MKFSTSLVFTTLALAGSAIATPAPEAIAPSYSYGYKDDYNYNPHHYKPEHKTPYKVYDKYYD